MPFPLNPPKISRDSHCSLVDHQQFDLATCGPPCRGPVIEQLRSFFPWSAEQNETFLDYGLIRPDSTIQSYTAQPVVHAVLKLLGWTLRVVEETSHPKGVKNFMDGVDVLILVHLIKTNICVLTSFYVLRNWPPETWTKTNTMAIHVHPPSHFHSKNTTDPSHSAQQQPTLRGVQMVTVCQRAADRGQVPVVKLALVKRGHSWAKKPPAIEVQQNIIEHSFHIREITEHKHSISMIIIWVLYACCASRFWTVFGPIKLSDLSKLSHNGLWSCWFWSDKI